MNRDVRIEETPCRRNSSEYIMKLKAKTLVPLLRTVELDKTIKFYTSVLGFVCVNHNTEWGWATLSLGEIEVMFALPNDHAPFERPDFTGSFYIRVENIEGWWKKMKSRAEVVYPLDEFDYGMREFAIYDNNRYMLQFGEEIKS